MFGLWACTSLALLLGVVNAQHVFEGRDGEPISPFYTNNLPCGFNAYRVRNETSDKGAAGFWYYGAPTGQTVNMPIEGKTVEVVRGNAVVGFMLCEDRWFGTDKYTNLTARPRCEYVRPHDRCPGPSHNGIIKHDKLCSSYLHLKNNATVRSLTALARDDWPKSRSEEGLPDYGPLELCQPNYPGDTSPRRHLSDHGKMRLPGCLATEEHCAASDYHRQRSNSSA